LIEKLRIVKFFTIQMITIVKNPITVSSKQPIKPKKRSDILLEIINDQL